MTKNYPKITIITPTYGQGHFIEQTIDSVLSQNYPNLEYMIFDGGSKDNTVEIIKKYEKHITFWVSEPDKGQSDAINKGLKRATGDIVNWLNSDDYYEPNCLHTIAENFQDSTINVVCGKSNLFKGDGEIVRESQGTDIYKDNLAKTIGWARIDQPETFFRKSAIDKMGFVDPNFHYVMDKEWWIRYLLLFGLDNIKKIDKKLVNFRLHEESKTVSQKDLFGVETASMYYNLAKTINEKEIAFNQTQYQNWFEALEDMCNQINKIDFDIAIIGCGTYGLPLAVHVKRKGKQGIHLGGATQILFGIKGKRWENSPFFKELFNDHWTSPLPSETPENHSNVEQSCYW